MLPQNGRQMQSNAFNDEENLHKMSAKRRLALGMLPHRHTTLHLGTPAKWLARVGEGREPSQRQAVGSPKMPSTQKSSGQAVHNIPPKYLIVLTHMVGKR